MAMHSNIKGTAGPKCPREKQLTMIFSAWPDSSLAKNSSKQSNSCGIIKFDNCDEAGLDYCLMFSAVLSAKRKKMQHKARLLY